MRRIARGALVACLCFASGCALVRGPVVYDEWSQLVAAPTEPAADLVTVRFLGVSTLLFEDGETALLIDGFFSRPGLLSVLFDWKIAPDPDRIDAALALAEVDEIAAVMTVHSHYDHAMDVALVAQRTGAMVLGSASTANIARGGGLAEEQIRVAVPGEVMRFGGFEVTFFEAKHFPLAPPADELLGTTIDAPLVPPAKMSAYGEGGSYSIRIAHPLGTALVQGSAGFVPGALEEVTADVVMLGIGGLGAQPPPYRAAYWNEVVRAIGARRVFPIHWDDFTLPLSQPLRAFPGAADDFTASLNQVIENGERDGIRVELLPLAEPVSIFDEAP